MMRKKSLAAPFVATIAAACARTGPAPQPESPNPPAIPAPSASSTGETASSAAPTASEAPTPSAAPSGSTAAIVYEGYHCAEGKGGPIATCPDALLPAAPTNRLVYKKYDGCHRVPDGYLVRCPQNGPTAILPDPLMVDSGSSKVRLAEASLTCDQSFTIDCPPGAYCNPPPPKHIDCPASLMPKLAPGVKPTKRAGNRCWFDVVEVACPKP